MEGGSRERVAGEGEAFERGRGARPPTGYFFFASFFSSFFGAGALPASAPAAASSSGFLPPMRSGSAVAAFGAREGLDDVDLLRDAVADVVVGLVVQDLDALGELQVLDRDRLVERQAADLDEDDLRKAGRRALDDQLGEDRLEDPAVGEALRDALELDRELGLDLVVLVDALEVDVDDGIGQGVVLELAEDGLLGLLAELQLDELAAGLEEALERLVADGDVGIGATQAVEDGRDVAARPHAASLGGALLVATRDGELDEFHGGCLPMRRRYRGFGGSPSGGRAGRTASRAGSPSGRETLLAELRRSRWNGSPVDPRCTVSGTPRTLADATREVGAFGRAASVAHRNAAVWMERRPDRKPVPDG